MRATSTNRTRKEARKTSKVQGSGVQGFRVHAFRVCAFKVRGSEVQRKLNPEPHEPDQPGEPGEPALLDRQRALHTGLEVAGERADERIGAGGRYLERHLDGFSCTRQGRVRDDV